tara:strand:+ start:21220 stop:21492 length:273 start_codon:yes stop_codon:yes gene_type:complete
MDWEDRARPDGFVFQQVKEQRMAQKPMAKDYPLEGSTGLKSYVQDMKAYDVTVGKNPNKRGLHNYKEAGIYCIQDLLDHRTDNPWSRVDL